MILLDLRRVGGGVALLDSIFIGTPFVIRSKGLINVIGELIIPAFSLCFST